MLKYQLLHTAQFQGHWAVELQMLTEKMDLPEGQMQK